MLIAYLGDQHRTILPSYNARYYNPLLSRFVSADTIIPGQSDRAGAANPQNLNRYSYVNNGPLSHSDPTGHAGSCNGSGGGGSSGDGCGGSGYGNGNGGTAPGYSGSEDLEEPVADPVAEPVEVSDTPPQIDPKTEEQTVEARADEGDSAETAQDGESACSFTPDTAVATAHGEQPLGTLHIGDQVLAYDPASGRTGSYTITAVLIHSDPVIETLTIDDETITTTPNHRFFTAERGWVHAGDLRKGEQVRTADGSYGTVQGFALAAQPQLMYNLTVAQVHTFFVGSGRWLVHNAGCKSPINITPERRTHVVERHTNSGLYPNKSKFYDGEDIDSLADEGRYATPIRGANGNDIHIVNAGRPVGVDVTTGQPTNYYTVVTSPNSSNLVTMHPGLPR